MNRCQLLIDVPRPGPENMALDEVLLERAIRDRAATMRFYQWSEPTVSLGYFQRYADRRHHIGSRQCPVVRRATGGGAIVHDRELTYSLTVPVTDRMASGHLGLYEKVHAALTSALACWGIEGRLRQCLAAAPPEGRQQPFLCFQRCSEHDLLVRDTKVAGSAQRRRQGALLQHGSVLLAASRHAAELPGILELTNVQIDPAQLIQRWLVECESRLGLKMECRQWVPPELERAGVVQQQQYCQQRWTQRR